AVEDEVTQRHAQRGPTRLTGEHDLVAGLLEGRGQPCHLGGLAGTVAALEGDEGPLSCAHPASLGEGPDTVLTGRRRRRPRTTKWSRVGPNTHFRRSRKV